MNHYELGEAVLLASDDPPFTTLVGAALIDPSALTLSVRDPSGAITAYLIGQLTHVSTGVFSLALTATKSGEWSYQFTAGGNVAGATPVIKFYVDPSPLFPGV
jgi:hypothetical protein